MTKTIEELKLEIISGTVLNRVRVDHSSDSTIDLKVLMPKAISDGIDLESLDEITVEIESIAQRKIKTTMIEDIVLKLTTPFDSVLITDDSLGLVVPSYFAILRSYDFQNINPKYLAFVLNSSYGKSRLASMTTGVANAMLKIKDIMTFPVPILPAKEQEMLGDLYISFCEKRTAMKKYLASEEALMDNIITEAISKEV